MNRQRHRTEKDRVVVWTPWGEQTLDQDESRRSKFRKRLELRRQRQSRKAAAPGKGTPRN